MNNLIPTRATTARCSNDPSRHRNTVTVDTLVIAYDPEPVLLKTLWASYVCMACRWYMHTYIIYIHANTYTYVDAVTHKQSNLMWRRIRSIRMHLIWMFRRIRATTAQAELPKNINHRKGTTDLCVQILRIKWKMKR